MSEQLSPTTSNTSQDENQNKETPVSCWLKNAKNDKEGRLEKKLSISAF